MKKCINAISLILAILAVCLLCNIENISSYFQDQETLDNKVVIGQVETEIVEENDTKTIVAGEEFKKVVRVKNVGQGQCYVRVRVLISPEQYANELNLDINTTDWEYIDGFYYYKNILMQGEETTPLFTKLTIPPNLQKGDIFDINIYCESIQSVAYDEKNNPIENFIKIFEKIEKKG